MIKEPYKFMQTIDGAKIRIGFWPASHPTKKAVRTVVLLQGRASFMEKYQEMIESLCLRGNNVWALDWRGQGLSSRMLSNHHKGHIDSYNTYLQDLHQLITEYVQPKRQNQLIILGQSMGGHLALRYLNEYQNTFDGAILVAPMIDIKTGAYPKFLARLLAQSACLIGCQNAYIVGQGNYNPIHEPFEGNYLTHDRRRYFAHRDLQLKNPGLVLGGGTYGWLQATFKSIQRIHQPTYLKQINVPILFIAAGDEEIIDNNALESVIKNLPHCEVKIYEHSRHQIFMETDEILEQFWTDYDFFIEKNFGAFEQALAKRRLIESSKLSGVQGRDTAFAKDANRLQPNY
jgi:lysophospholipase